MSEGLPIHPLEKRVITTAKPILMDKDRVTFHFTLHYEHRGESPHTVDKGCHWLTQTMEEPYTRRHTVKGADVGQCLWDCKAKIDTGWLTDPRVVVIENIEAHGALQPTEEESKALAKKVLHIHLSGAQFPSLTLQPGQAQPLLLSSGVTVEVSAEHHQSVNYRVTAYGK